MSDIVSGISVWGALLGTAMVAAIIALIVGLTGYGARQFGLRVSGEKIVVAWLGAWMGSLLISFGLYPLLMRMGSGASPIISTLLAGLVIYGVPPLLFAWCLKVAADWRSNQAQAAAFIGYGATIALLSVAVLLLSALIPGDWNRVPLVAEGLRGFKDSMWLSLVIGGALVFAGYAIGSKLKPPISVPAGGAGAILPPPPPPDPETKIHGVAPVSTQRWLVVANGRGSNVKFDLADGESKIGRVATCAVRVGDDEEVSREHALLRISHDKVVLEDLASRNGTFLNEARVREPRTLQDGDRIRIGNSTLEFKQVN